MSLSLRRALKIFGVLFLFSLLSVVLSVIVLGIHGRADFISTVTQYGGHYNTIIADAHKAGYAGSATFSFKNTILAMPLAFASFGYAIVSAYAGGEVRSAKDQVAARDAVLACDLRRARRGADGPGAADVRQRLPRLGHVPVQHWLEAVSVRLAGVFLLLRVDGGAQPRSDRGNQLLLHRRLRRRAAGHVPDRQPQPVRLVVRPRAAGQGLRCEP